MRKIIIFFFVSLISVAFLYSCRSKESKSCQYRLEQLVAVDTPNTIVTYRNDTLTEVRDKKGSTPSGLYTFDKNGRLRFYGFFVNENEYRYSEVYDDLGNIIEKEGTPLAEYRLWEGSNDTILFNAFLFSLNKRYEDIEIISSKGDTILPKYLFKADIYSNMKCFSFKLRVAKNINELVLYTKGVVVNTCTEERGSFSDTTSFAEVKF